MPENHPSRFFAYVAASIDGKICQNFQKLPDWTSSEDQVFLQERLQLADARVVGRNTFIAAGNRLQGKTTFVLTTKEEKTEGTVRFINPWKSDLKEALAPYKHVAILGGPWVYEAMLERGLMDELFVTIEPFIFGWGKEMFIKGNRVEMELVSIQKMNEKGTLLAHYRPKK